VFRRVWAAAAATGPILVLTAVATQDLTVDGEKQ
jgi:hypothetical protein